MTALLMNMAEQRSKELRDYAAARRTAGIAGQRRHSLTARPAARPTGDISIRRLTNDDTDAVDRVAGRDTANRPSGDLLGAEMDGRLVAAISITTGETVADPFTRTEAARSMLVLRAAQVRESRAGDGHSRRHGIHRLAAFPRRSA